tara:strand:- start:1378 stop:1716 length:339 start_codon:yes stop_codon:yes gene_type:complete
MSEDEFIQRSQLWKFLHIEQRLFEANQEVMNAEEAFVFHQRRYEAFSHKFSFKMKFIKSQQDLRSSKEHLQAVVFTAKCELHFAFDFIRDDEENFQLLHNLYFQMKDNGEIK